MSDEDALLTAIAAHPDEDTPRLAYADWLDENADALPDPGLARVRAEFIRLQIELAPKEERSFEVLQREAPLFRRNEELLEAHRGALLGPLAALEGSADVWFRRGFVSQVRLPVDAFLAHAERLAGARPVPDIRVTGVAGRLADFLRCPRLDLVTELSVYPTSPAVAGGVPGERELTAGVRRLTRLAVLDLEGCGVGDWFCAMVGNFPLPALEALSLSRNAITDTGVLDLLHTDHPKKLRRLLLSANPIGDAGAVWLADRWPRGADDRLEYLGLRDTQIGAEGETALVARFGRRAEMHGPGDF